MKQVFLVMLLAGYQVVPLTAGHRSVQGFNFVPPAVVQDTNRWEIWQDNLGRFVMPLPGSSPGGFWPKHSGRNYLFGAGIWVGAMDTTDRDTVVVVGYNPNSGATEWGPCLPNGDTTGAGSDSLARVYCSDVPKDTAQWPERDSLGRAIIFSDKELWAISSALYSPPPPSRPLGVVTVRRTLAWNSPGLWGDIVKMEFEVKNVTGRWQGRPRTLRKMIIGLCVDADIGYESSTNGNDQCYAYHTPGSPYPNQAVQYQLVQEFGWSITPPYFEGMHFVQTPKATDSVRVRDSRYPHTILPGQSLGMTAFKIWDIARDPQGTYLLLAGMFSLSDTNSAYDSDSLGPGDKRFLMCSGPFDLPNDSTVKLVAHIIGANDSVDLRRKAELLGVESPPGPVAREPSGAVLYPSIPNPSSGPCLIRYALPAPVSVTLRIYDICGRLVRKLDQGERQAGSHSIRWDGRNGAGLSVPGGVYLYRLEAGGFTRTRSVVLLR